MHTRKPEHKQLKMYELSEGGIIVRKMLSNLKLNNQFALENNTGFNLRPFYLLVFVVCAINENPQ